MNAKYEVHPTVDEQSWCVVNNATGQVRNEALSYDNAIALADELNKCDDTYLPTIVRRHYLTTL